MKTLEYLKAVRELLSDEKRWTQGESARDKDELSVLPEQVEACAWCLMGAAGKVTEEEGPKAFYKVLNSLRKAGDLNFLSAFNDTHSHAEVLQLLDKAINENT